MIRRTLALKALDSRLANAGATNPRKSGAGRLGTPSRVAPAASTASVAGPSVPAPTTAQTGNGIINSRTSVEQGKGKAKAPEEAA
jgi:hypothetical protein